MEKITIQRQQNRDHSHYTLDEVVGRPRVSDDEARKIIDTIGGDFYSGNRIGSDLAADLLDARALIAEMQWNGDYKCRFGCDGDEPDFYDAASRNPLFAGELWHRGHKPDCPIAGVLGGEE